MFSITVLFVTVCAFCVCSAVIDPRTDEACTAIGGDCQHVSLPCSDYGKKKYYERLCYGRSRYCCAAKTDETECESQGGSCNYHCVGSKHFPDIKCEGHLKCCIALIK